MAKVFSVNQDSIENNLSPNYYIFKRIIDDYSKRQDVISFSLGDEGVLKKLTDGEHAGQTFASSGALFIKNSSVKRNSINLFDGFYISNEKNESLKRSILKKDDVLFTTIGNVGVSSLVNENVEGANINQNVVTMRIDSSYCTPEYLSCYLNSKLVKFQVDSLFSGNIYPMLSYPKIKNIKVFVKSRDIEKEVTSLVRESNKLEIKSLGLIKKAQELFDEEINGAILKKEYNKKSFYVNYTQFESSNLFTPMYFLPEIVENIESVKNSFKWKYLGDIVKFKKGDEPGSDNYIDYKESKDNDYPFIRTSDIVNYDIDLYPDFFLKKNIFDDLNQDIKTEEVLFSKDGKIGEVSMITPFDKCVLGSGFLRICAIEKEINPYYLFIALTNELIGKKQAAQRTVIASTIPHIREDRIADFIIPFVSKYDDIVKLTKEAFKLKNERKIIISKINKIIEMSLDY